MKKISHIFLYSFILSIFGFFGMSFSFVYAASPTLSVFPEKVIQGEPAVITVSGISNTFLLKSIMFENNSLPVFLHNNEPTTLIGIDLRAKVGTSTITATFWDGLQLQKNFVVKARPRLESPLGIPEKLGGNSQASTNNLVSKLDLENQEIARVRTGLKAFWKEGFQAPLTETIVTDSYGYTRETNGYEIAHKGTDFHADIGTPVMAMNRGVVRVAKTYQVYGKTIIVDHGLGLSTLYMHLSKMYVNVGELVLPGEIIGRSGDTGYAEKPHLHISVKINKISIDPLKFLELFNSH